MPYSLRLVEDVLAPGRRHEAAARPITRVVYLLDGTVEALESDRARLASGAITAGARGARLLRWELVRQPPPPAGGRVLLEHPLELDAKALDVRIVPFDDVPEGAQTSIGRVSIFRQGL